MAPAPPRLTPLPSTRRRRRHPNGRASRAQAATAIHNRQLSPRLVAPGVNADQLPRLDAVVISHMHFDHLSLGTLDMIDHKTTVIVLPEGGAVYVPGSRAPSALP